MTTPDPLVTLLTEHCSGVTVDDWGVWHQYRDLEQLAAAIRGYYQEESK